MLDEFRGMIEFRFLIGLILSLFAGLLMGAERESKGKDAGIGTHTLVIVGSMLFTFISSIADPQSTSRIAAQIVTGIGFLGAGLIIREGLAVRNLTTAASIWFAGAIGMAFGFGHYFIGIIATVTSLYIAIITSFFKKRMHKTPNKILQYK